MDAKETELFAELINQHELDPGTAMRVLKGNLTLEQAVATRDLRRRANYVGSETRIAISWDLDRRTWPLSLDPPQSDTFFIDYPDAELVWADLAQLVEKLTESSRRREDEHPFDADYAQKTKQLVAHLEQGGQVSPPLIRSDGAGLTIQGGNHRLWWAVHMSQQAEDIPILVRAHELPMIEALVSVRRGGSGGFRAHGQAYPEGNE